MSECTHRRKVARADQHTDRRLPATCSNCGEARTFAADHEEARRYVMLAVMMVSFGVAHAVVAWTPGVDVGGWLVPSDVWKAWICGAIGMSIAERIERRR